MVPQFCNFGQFQDKFWTLILSNTHTRPPLGLNLDPYLSTEKDSAQANPGEERSGLPKSVASYTRNLYWVWTCGCFGLQMICRNK